MTNDDITDGDADAADRRAELIAAALADDLDPGERAELDRLEAHDPTVATELAELRGLLGWIGDTDLGPVDPRDLAVGVAPDAEAAEAADAAALRDRVLGGLADPGTAGTTPDREEAPATVRGGPRAPADEAAVPSGASGTSRWRTRALALAAAAGLVLGVGGSRLVDALTDDPTLEQAQEADEVTGPPGTLGAVEPLSVPGVPAGSEVEAAFVAHTWGTETLLEIDGLDMGETYEVVLIGSDGTEFESGTFIATPERVVCRMNAAVLREDVQTLEIRDVEGHLDLTVDVPPVARS